MGRNEGVWIELLSVDLIIISVMQQVRAENKKLKQLQRSCEEELQKLKEVGRTHENEIDTLLKFNERLLGIIENQFNTATKNKITSDLQIISEINEGNTEFNPNNKLANKLTSPPQIKGNFQQQDLEGFEDEDEEEIYNKEAASPQASPVMQPAPPKAPEMLAPPAKVTKLDRVYEMQHKDEEVSINLSNSLKTNNPSESLHNHRSTHPQAALQQPAEEPTAELQQLKDMIKQYREQFVENSSQYEQICEIIHNDLLSDLQEFRRIEEESTRFYEQKVSAIGTLRAEIKRFQPISELVRVMKKVNVPPSTERLLSQKIISKYM